ncbi:MAG: hypothetical protein WC460_06030 [Patescibacteria group bacterium]
MVDCPEKKKIFEFLRKSDESELTEEELTLVFKHMDSCPICEAIFQKELAELPDDYFEKLGRKIIKGMHDSVNKLPWRKKYSIKFRLFKNGLRAKLDRIFKMRYTA